MRSDDRRGDFEYSREAIVATEWRIKAVHLGNCNCAYGCPCKFTALPTHGNCRSVVAYAIEEGYFGAIRLDGLRAALITSWPGAIHEGNGTMQVIIDERADESQRGALLKILTGGETDDMATIWWVFSAMCPNKLEPLFLPIEVAIDVEARRGHIRVPGIIETIGEPIRNPVTGAEHRARIQMPEGVEFRIAEAASGTTRTTGQIPLPDLQNTHAQFTHIHFSNTGVVD
jgi:hypothetical protein